MSLSNPNSTFDFSSFDIRTFEFIPMFRPGTRSRCGIGPIRPSRHWTEPATRPVDRLILRFDIHILILSSSSISYNTRSNKVRVIKTPGGKLRYLYIKKRGTAPKCGDCGIKLPGVCALSSIMISFFFSFHLLRPELMLALDDTPDVPSESSTPSRPLHDYHDNDDRC